ncbi:MAG: hypothetical protein CMK00_01095 [Planctomycetes bacterium]|nr:hypothetical protein [Planctomycetota bacterium]HJO26888.1 hypothetical protein [Planctomycetota bacterium]
MVVGTLLGACGRGESIPAGPPGGRGAAEAPETPAGEGSGEQATSVSASADSSPEAAAITQLVRALTPPDLTWTSDRLDARFHAGRELLGRLKQGDPELGREALRRLLADNPEEITVRNGLLEVGAHSAPVDARPLLDQLVLEYGHRMSDRTEAVRLLAETSPARAEEILGPLLRQERLRQTMPDQEFLLAGWLTACERTGTDPVEVLATVAGNIFMQDAARHRAVQELGEHPGTLSRATLEVVLVESTGNGYLRRKAAQALASSLPAETACSIFKEVAEKEADRNMLIFLLNILEEVCG